MKSIFLEGLKSAREIVQSDGISKLDDLISELEGQYRETAAVTPMAETR